MGVVEPGLCSTVQAFLESARIFQLFQVSHPSPAGTNYLERIFHKVVVAGL